jgi:hypothetical protein
MQCFLEQLDLLIIKVCERCLPLECYKIEYQVVANDVTEAC